MMAGYQIGKGYELVVGRVYDHVVNGVKTEVEQPAGTQFVCHVVDGAGNAWYYDDADYWMIGNVCSLMDGLIAEVA